MDTELTNRMTVESIRRTLGQALASSGADADVSLYRGTFEERGTRDATKAE
jgi:hypothetical protein